MLTTVVTRITVGVLADYFVIQTNIMQDGDIAQICHVCLANVSHWSRPSVRVLTRHNAFTYESKSVGNFCAFFNIKVHVRIAVFRYAIT